MDIEDAPVEQIAEVSSEPGPESEPAPAPTPPFLVRVARATLLLLLVVILGVGLWLSLARDLAPASSETPALLTPISIWTTPPGP
jgi:hypothetical protein